MGETMEHDDAVVAARAHLATKDRRPLGPLPSEYGATRMALHSTAENVMKPRRELETGNEIALQFTPGGFGSPPWDVGAASGVGGQIRVDGVDLGLLEGADESRAPVEGVDADSAAALAD